MFRLYRPATRCLHLLLALILFFTSWLAVAMPVAQAAPANRGADGTPTILAAQTVGNGPETPVNGWTNSTIQAGTKTISAIADLPDGRVFAAVAGDGLRVYSPDANGVYSWQAAPAGGPASLTVNDLAVLGNQLWVGTGGSGISILNLTTNTWSTNNTSNSPLPSNTINRLTVVDRPTGQDEVWVSTSGGAARYRTPPDVGNISWKVFTTADGLPSNGIFDVALWEQDNLSYAYIATDSGVRLYNGSSMTAVGGGDGCLFDRATRILVDKANLLWFVSEVNIPTLAATNAPSAAAVNAPSVINANWQPTGICRYAYSIFGGVWTALNTPTIPWPSNLISDMSVDHAGRVWLSFRPGNNNTTGGAAAFDRGHWLILKQPDAPLVTNHVNRVRAIGNDVWFGHTNASAVSIYSPNWSYFNQTSLQVNTAPTTLLLEATRGWVGAGQQISQWNGQNWQARTIPGASAVTALTRGSDGQLWIGTAADGLWVFDNVNSFTQHTATTGLAGNSVTALRVDAAGRLWVATRTGLSLYGNGAWLSFTPGNSGLTSADLTALTNDATGRLWIGTAANGLAILDPEANGNPAWSTQTTANGLPADTIHGLATDPNGAIWVATANGVGKWEPQSGIWSVFNTTHGLPSNEILSITADPTGVIWAGTRKGVAAYQGASWQPYHVSGSFLGADHVVAVAADETHLWAVAGNQVALRNVIIEPIGNKPPVINTITPGKGGPQSQVTITGTDFDERGPEFNEVRFCCIDGQAGTPAPKAKVLTATSTQLVVETPALAKTGKIVLKTQNGQSESFTEFKITPAITSLDRTCAGPGELLTIYGSGFTGSGGAAAYVTIGNGAERTADVTSPNEIKTYIRNEDTNGPVKVRLLNNEAATSAQSLDIAKIQMQQVAVQQAIQDQQNIWGKRTLVQVTLTTQGSCGATVDGGRLTWKLKNGSTRPGGVAYFPSASGLVVTQQVQPISLNTAVNFVAEFNSARSGYSDLFPLSEFAGVQITLRRGFQNILQIDVPPSAFNFIDTGSNRTFMSMRVTSPDVGDNDPTFWAVARNNMAQAARIYPQQDVSIFHGPQAWMGWTPIWFSTTDFDFKLGEYDEAHDIIDMVDDYLDPSGDTYGVALVDPVVADPENTAAGLSTGGHTVLVLNDADEGGKTFIHEGMHSFGAVDSDQPNHISNFGDHSRYDEGRWFNADAADQGISNCMPSLNFRQALIDETGGVRRVVKLDSGAPVELTLLGCGQWSSPKSLLSYAPRRNNTNTFLEPLDYQFALEDLDALAHRMAVAVAAAAGVTDTLHLAGDIDLSNKVTITIAYPSSNGDPVTPPTLGGHYHLQLRGASDLLLHDQPFDLLFAGGHTHAEADYDHHANPDLGSAHFNLRIPLPAGTLKAEIRHEQDVIWSKSVSANAPTVTLNTPNGGSFQATDTIAVSWNGADADNDPLLYALDYSADNGQSWIVLVPSLTATTFAWQPNYIPASATALLRIRASDGFKTATATSAPFALAPQAPLAFILEPSQNLTFTEGATVDLIGGSVTAAGFDQGAFVWSHNGQNIAATKDATYTLNAVGQQIFTIQVTADNMAASDSVTVTVVADYDHDGLPNSWELKHSLNPLDAADAYVDTENDGLLNLQEYQLGTNPRQADSDGDTAADGAEVAVGTDPLRADQKPATGPVLQVGAATLEFIAGADGLSTAPQKFWVTNSGAGALAWSATSDASWLTITPAQGAAPQEVTVSATPGTLGNGVYTGLITFSAAGAANSPTTVMVKLTIGNVVENGMANRIFLPLVNR